MIKSFSWTPWVTCLLSFLGGISAPIIGLVIKKKFSRGKAETIAPLDLIDEKIQFSASSSNQEAESLFGTDGLALIAEMELGAKEGPVIIHRAILEFWYNGENKKFCGTLSGPRNILKIEENNYEKISFIFNPRSRFQNLAQLIRDLTDAPYKLTIFGPNKTVLYASANRKKLNYISKRFFRKVYIVDIPPQEEPENAEEIKTILSRNGVKGVEIRTQKIEKVNKGVIQIDSRSKR